MAATAGPVLLAYDGSKLAGFAIEQAGAQLAAGREALVVCVWRPADVDFVPPDPAHLRATDAAEVLAAAEATATHGAELAMRAGFRAQPVTVEAAPTWKGLVTVAEEHSVSLIVLGTHRHAGILGHLMGSVASATVAHFPASVLVVHEPRG